MINELVSLLDQFFQGRDKRFLGAPAPLSAGKRAATELSALAAIGMVDARPVVAIAGDLAVFGNVDGPVVTKQIRHAVDISTNRGMPLVLLMSGSSNSHSVRGAAAYGREDTIGLFARRRKAPWAAAVLGDCRGSAAFHAAVSDYLVVGEGARLSPVGVSLPDAQEETAALRGLGDLAVTDVGEGFAAIRNFLSLVPSHCGEQAPLIDGLVPTSATAPNPESGCLRSLVHSVIDTGSLIELRPGLADAVFTGLARIDGRTVGVLATGGAECAAAAFFRESSAKAMRLLIFCDSFNIPIVYLADQPVLVRVAGPDELVAMLHASTSFLSALAFCSVPKVTVITGVVQGDLAMLAGIAGGMDEVAIWDTATVRYADAGDAESPFQLAEAFRAHTVIAPRETARYLREVVATMGRSNGASIGDHRLAGWPNL